MATSDGAELGDPGKAASARPDTHFDVLDRLVDVVHELSSSHDLHTVVDIVRRAAHELTGADRASVVLHGAGPGHFGAEEAADLAGLGARVDGWVMQHRQATVIDDLDADPRIAPAARRGAGVRSLAAAPVRIANPMGSICSYWARRGAANAHHLKLLQALADIAAVAIENIELNSDLERRVRTRTATLERMKASLETELSERERMEAAIRQLSITDELTGLLNRRGFYALADQQLQFSRRMNEPCWLAFGDIDGLKRVNDALGHQAGDELIVAAAALLRRHFRESDVIARLGGDEFAVFGHGTSAPVEAIRHRLTSDGDLADLLKREGVSLTVSIGTAKCDPGCRKSLEELLAEADQAMYREKQQARH